MDDTSEEIVDFSAYHCYILRDHESYFNWIDSQFDVTKAQDRISSRQCEKACADISECEFCSLNGEWRHHVEPFPFMDGDKDQGHFHEFVSQNSEMAFLEAFTGKHEKSEGRLEYLNLAIGCVAEEHHLDYLDAYKYITATIGAYIQFCKSSLSRSDVALLPRFKDISQRAQIGVLSMKFIFCKEKDSVKIQVPILRKLVELDPTNAIWHESLGLRLRVIRKESGLKYGQQMEKCSSEQTIAFTMAYNLRPDIPRFFASFSRNVAETWKENKHQSLTQPIKINVLDQSFETVKSALNFLKSGTRFLLEAADDIEEKNDTANALSSMCEVFSVSLPKPLQDLELAEKCITVAVQICPTSSKANHRMGLFQFLKRRNYDIALKHLTLAVHSKAENFYAVVDWIQLLIHKSTIKSKLLIDIFTHIFDADLKWTSGQTARLMFLKGCHNFIVKGKNTETMDAWTRAYQADDKTHHFTMAFSEAIRFQWRGFDVKEILKFLTASNLKSTPTVKQMINEIRERGATSKHKHEFIKAQSEQK